MPDHGDAVGKGIVGARLLLIVLIVGTACGQAVPSYRIDPLWPKRLPNNWILGHVEQIVVDSKDHIWVLHYTGSLGADDLGLAQTPRRSACCIAAPAVLEFDTDGNVLNAWGGFGYVADWPSAVHGFTVDAEGNVWISGNWVDELVTQPTFPPKDQLRWDRQILKFSRDGKLLLEIGHPTKSPINNQDTSILGAPSSMKVDDATHELFVADGYLNRRVVVYDSRSGEFLRGWGAYGIPLAEVDNSPLPAYDRTAPPYDPTKPPLKQFRGPVVGIQISSDGLVYVCDRTSDRIQVFTKQGKFVQEFIVSPDTRGQGSTMALAFSRDSAQRFLFVADGEDNVVWILNRQDGKVLSSFGHRGHNAGEFDYLDSIAIDSCGNLYTGEVKYNNRLQRFLPANAASSGQRCRQR